MAVIFGSGVTVISSFWTTFKATVMSKSLSVQYQDDGNVTTVFAFDGTALAYSAIMYDGGNVPLGLQIVYSVVQNNSDLSDFQTNWQPTANQQVDATVSTGSLGVLNATVQVALGSNQTVGFQIAAGTLIGDLLPETSFDDGVTWNQTFFSIATTFTKQAVIGYVSANGTTAGTIIVPGGTSLVRVRVFIYTSGTCNITMRTSSIHDPTLATFITPPANGMPPSLAIIGGSVTTAAPTYTTALANALSLNTSGGLRVDGSGVTQPVSGTVAISGTVANTQSTSPWVDNITQIGGVVVAAVAKGTQATNALGVQDFKDSGRVSFVATANVLAGVTSEALISLTPIRTVTAGAAGTTLTVTAGKTLRIQSLTLSVRNTSTVVSGAIIRVRMLAGSVLVGSQEYFSLAASTLSATTGITASAAIDFPDGFEISGTTQIGITQLCSATTCTLDVSIIGFEY